MNCKDLALFFMIYILLCNFSNPSELQLYDFYFTELIDAIECLRYIKILYI